jgi:drug/metabolite transporter (DMT)-like permease
MSRVAILFALAAAVLFGLSTPVAKLLVGGVDPWLLAGLFYLGSGLGLAAVRAVRSGRRGAVEAPLARSDLPWLAGAILSGGVAGPILMMAGLAETQATTASLLLTLEGMATALIAWFVFRENVDRRLALGMIAIVAGAAVLAWQGEATLAGAFGPLLIVGACLAWGIDNNLTRKVALADPVQIAMLKGLAAGPVSLALAFARGAEPPPLDIAAAAAVVGFFGYGVSLVLFVLALRHLGTARTGAYFSTAPFIGAAAAMPLLGEAPTGPLAAAAVLMGIGVWLHITERHEHEHEHDALEHTHRHRHDAHHQHAHGPGDPPGEPHSHRHAHVRLRHRHAHAPDSHHRHRH